MLSLLTNKMCLVQLKIITFCSIIHIKIHTLNIPMFYKFESLNHFILQTRFGIVVIIVTTSNIRYFFVLVEYIQTYPHLFMENHPPVRRTSEASIVSTMSGMVDMVPITTVTSCKFSTYILFFSDVLI